MKTAILAISFALKCNSGIRSGRYATPANTKRASGDHDSTTGSG